MSTYIITFLMGIHLETDILQHSLNKKTKKTKAIKNSTKWWHFKSRGQITKSKTEWNSTVNLFTLLNWKKKTKLKHYRRNKEWVAKTNTKSVYKTLWKLNSKWHLGSSEKEIKNSIIQHTIRVRRGGSVTTN